MCGPYLMRPGTTGAGLYWTALVHSGVRLSELLGVMWQDVDLDAGTITIRQNLQRIDHEWVSSTPKTPSGSRVIWLAEEAVGALRTQRCQQDEWRVRAGKHWCESGLVFSTRRGNPLYPAEVQHALADVCRSWAYPKSHLMVFGIATQAFFLREVYRSQTYRTDWGTQTCKLQPAYTLMRFPGGTGMLRPKIARIS